MPPHWRLRCHSIYGLGALTPAGTNQQALQASRASQDGPWAVTSCSSGDQGGPWLLLLGISVLLLPRGPVCNPSQSVFPALISPGSVEKSSGGPREVTASTGRAGDKALLPFYTHPAPPPEPWSSLLMDPGRTPLALGWCLGLVNIGIFPFRSLIIDTGFQDVGNWVSSVFPSCVQARKVKTIGRTERLNLNDHRILHLHYL